MNPPSSPASPPPPLDDSSLWDWNSLLDFSIDAATAAVDPFPFSFPSPTAAAEVSGDSPAASEGEGRVRKRDPRLVCPNYLAGRVPCACPELDALAAAEDEAAVAGARKRARTARAAGVIRCQVVGCEVDISELKGYHKRHRVCLRCANVPSVVIDGVDKRYCQQCGKFHVLPDFDEGKRSCRRKLERHNKRRRRRPMDSGSVAEKEAVLQEDIPVDASVDDEPRKDIIDEFACDTVETVVSNKIIDGEIPLASDDAQRSPIGSVPSSRTDHSNSIVSFTASGEAQMDERISNSKLSLSPSLSDQKIAYSSLCPTGRISFKLYDWNPAEFPRRLRHQIFQWLANMPIELEGYIRPGCTILTAFIMMPQSMWDKFNGDVADYVIKFINAPESLLLGQGTILIYLGNRIVQVLKDGTSLMNIKMEVQAPRLHYVYPAYFEAGKTVEFIACGSYLKQHKFRFLVSFAGEYLKHDSCHFICPKKIRHGDDNSADCDCTPEHETVRIKLTHSDPEVFGPAFIEVENASGVSNFVPMLVGSRKICSELERMEMAFGNSCRAGAPQNILSALTPNTCEVLASKQIAMSALLLDIAWLLRKPHYAEKEVSPKAISIESLISLLKFLIQNEFFNILDGIMNHVDKIVSIYALDRLDSDVNLRVLHKCISQAREILHQSNARGDCNELLESEKPVHDEAVIPQCHSNDISATYFSSKEERNQDKLSMCAHHVAEDGCDEKVPLVTQEFTQRRVCNLNFTSKYSWGGVFSTNVMRTRLSLFALASVIMCLSACIVFLHPHKAREFVVSVRRCTFGDRTP